LYSICIAFAGPVSSSVPSSSSSPINPTWARKISASWKTRVCVSSKGLTNHA
jgi:hypothetical protein